MDHILILSVLVILRTIGCLRITSVSLGASILLVQNCISRKPTNFNYPNLTEWESAAKTAHYSIDKKTNSPDNCPGLVQFKITITPLTVAIEM